jgi:hypothetical protein
MIKYNQSAWVTTVPTHLVFHSILFYSILDPTIASFNMTILQLSVCSVKHFIVKKKSTMVIKHPNMFLAPNRF